MDNQLERVALNLNQIIIQFWEKKLAAQEPRFTSHELRQVVNHYHYGTAPASADRVLRQLRKQGKVNYAVINRGKSLYLALPLGVQ